MRSPQTLFARIAILLSLITAAPAQGAERVWTGRSLFPSNDNWSNTGNWDLFTPPDSGDVALFTPAGSRLSPLVDVDSTIGGLEFRDDILFAAPAYSIVGTRTLTVGTDGIFNTSRTAQAISAPIALTAGGAEISNFESDDGRLTLQIINLGSLQLNMSPGPAGIVVNGVIRGSGQLQSYGSGRLDLTASNIYTGDTTIGRGTLRLSGAGRLSDATNVIVAGGGRFELVGITDVVNSLSGAQLTVGTVGLLSNATLILGTNPGSGGFGKFSGNIDGNGGLTKRGTGALRLLGANTYSGNTLIENGLVSVDNSALSPNSAVIANAGLFDMTGEPGIYTCKSLQVGTAGTVRLDAGADKLLRTGNVTVAGLGRFDMGNNDLVMDAANLDAITALIASGRNGGTTGLWSGPGITSSTAAASGHSLGAILNDNGLGQPLYTSFHGATKLTTSAILVAYTLTGDLNLDGTVSISDFIDLASHFGETNATWRGGDVNYDRQVSIADFIDLAANFGAIYTGSAPAEAHTLAVPEPSMIVTGAIALGCACLRRRARRGKS